jgi:hypothetical protein
MEHSNKNTALYIDFRVTNVTFQPAKGIHHPPPYRE